MAPLRSVLATTLLFLSVANAHFKLTNPPPLEGDKVNSDLEVNAPCGGGVPDLTQNTAIDFHVDGDSVAVSLGHAQCNWLIRATLDTRAAGDWVQLFPVFEQNGRGNLCQPAVAVPKEWVGKKGIIGVASKATDGILYQCAAVNFVAGAGVVDAATCSNETSVTTSFLDDPTLTALVGGGSTTTGPGPAATTSGNSAPSLLARGRGLPIGRIAAVTGFMLVVGMALL